jgi:serine/threonine protein kinase
LSRDIKLENVLFDNCHNAKLIDFGFSVQCKEPKRLKVFCGTPRSVSSALSRVFTSSIFETFRLFSYMAPEIVKRCEYLGAPVDMWAMGVVLFAMLSGCFPFSAKTYPDLYKKVVRGTFQLPDSFSSSLRDLLSSLLCYDPSMRMTVTQARNHPWVRAHTSPPLKHTPCAQLTVSKDARLDIYKEAVARMTALGVDRDALVTDVITKQRNSLTTCYYLLAVAMRLRHKPGGL